MWLGILFHTVLYFVGLLLFLAAAVFLNQVFRAAVPWIKPNYQSQSWVNLLLDDNGEPVKKFGRNLIVILVVILAGAFLVSYRDATGRFLWSDWFN